MRTAEVPLVDTGSGLGRMGSAALGYMGCQLVGGRSVTEVASTCQEEKPSAAGNHSQACRLEGHRRASEASQRPLGWWVQWHRTTSVVVQVAWEPTASTALAE